MTRANGSRPETAPGRLSKLYDPRTARRSSIRSSWSPFWSPWSWSGGHYAVQNMAKLGIPLNFAFWNQTAGFEINQSLISYSALSTYGQAFWVGLLNTLLVSAIGIVFATIIGFVIAICRLSPNWIVSKLATVYVELFRNIPLLLQLRVLVQCGAEIAAGAAPVDLGFRRRLPEQPRPHPAEPDLRRAVPGCLAPSVAGGIAASIGFWIWASRRQERDRPAVCRSAGLPRACAWAAGSSPIWPCGLRSGSTSRSSKGFNFIGGKPVFPELAALVLGLSIYTGAFISEIVRRRHPGGRSRAARGRRGASGFAPTSSMTLVVIPQAMRVIIPPLTNQYLNLIKNSSLAVFIGYPDLVQVFAGTVLNQTGAAVQCMAVTMGVYLAISLVTSTAMNVYNRRVALVER